MNDEQAEAFRKALEHLMNEYRVSLFGLLNGTVCTAPLKEGEAVEVVNVGQSMYQGQPTGYWDFNCAIKKALD